MIDQDFLKSVIDSVAPPTINQSTPNNGQSNNKTIGDILTTVVNGTSQTGTTSYSVFMDKVVEESQNYFTNVVNKNRESLNQYNNATTAAPINPAIGIVPPVRHRQYRSAGES